MKGITFGNHHSYDEWGLVLKGKEIQAPEPKVQKIEIEGGDGFLDLTDFLVMSNTTIVHCPSLSAK